MYYEYWGLKKPPFDNVPDPSMYVDSHLSMENAIAETLFAIEEGGESISVIVGDVGLGKTLSLRLIIDSLDQEKYRIAFITNPSITFVQLTKEIIGQLTGQPQDNNRKVDLLETFNRILFETIDEGRKVLIFIDEANAIAPANLENLRLLTNMQDDQRNLFTMVLAGQTELAKRLEHPSRANLFQRIGTYNRIEKINTPEMVKSYVETRLKLAGSDRVIFPDDVFEVLLEQSEHGVPRLINKICKLSLKAGETNGLKQIPGDMVWQIGERFQRVTGSSARKKAPEKRIKRELKEAPVQFAQSEEPVPVDHLEPLPEPETFVSQERVFSVDPPAAVITSEALIEETDPPAVEDVEEKMRPRLVFEKAEPERPSPQNHSSQEDKTVDVEIGDIKAAVPLPFQVIRQARSSTSEHCLKLAGVMAAQFLKEHPQLTSSRFSDPVEVWSRIRESVLHRFEEEKRQSLM